MFFSLSSKDPKTTTDDFTRERFPLFSLASHLHLSPSSPLTLSLSLCAAVWNFPSPGGAAVLREMVKRRMKRKARRGRVNAA